MLQLKKMNKPLRLLLTVLILSFAADSISLALSESSVNNYLILNLYLISQFFVLAWILRSQANSRILMDSIIWISIIFCFINFTLFQGPWKFNSVSNVLASLILISFCLNYFFRLINDLPIVHIQQLPMFWISMGILTYYAGNFFLFLVKNYLLYGEDGSHRLMWVLHNLLNITKNILFAIGLWQSYRKARSSISSSLAH
jgi:hypothetical protein